MVLRFRARPAHSLFSRFMFSFQGSVPSDFGFCFVAVSRRLVYNTTWSRLCQHFFQHFFKIFCETPGLVEKETCLIIAFVGIKISSKNLKKSAFFICFFHKNRRKSVKFFSFSRNFSQIFACFSLKLPGKFFAVSAIIPKNTP